MTITHDERERAIQMFGEGMDTYAISKLLGVHESVVSRVIHEHRNSRNIGPHDYDTTEITDYHKR